MKRTTGLALTIALFQGALHTDTADALPTVVDPALSLSVYDSGGFLDSSANGGHTLGGLEVDSTGTVFVVGANGPPGFPSTRLRLIRSTGLGTATPVGGTEPIRLTSRGFDLTTNPADGTLNVVGAMAGVGGIYGFDPAGVAPLTTFATTSAPWATSGLTFDATGTTALVTTDGAGAGVLPLGLYSIPAGGPESVVFGPGALPAGIPAGTDDHVITLDGRTIIVGDGSHDLWDASGGPGTLSLLIDLDVAVPGASMGAGGNRAVVDPVSGDIFVAWGLSAGTDIIRVKADGSAAEVFATGMGGERIRDLAFGPASDGSGDTNLYISAALISGEGTIYEATVPEPSTAVLALLGLAGASVRRRRR